MVLPSRNLVSFPFWAIEIDAGLLGHDYNKRVRIFGNADTRPVSGSKLLVQFFVLSKRQNAHPAAYNLSPLTITAPS